MSATSGLTRRAVLAAGAAAAVTAVLPAAAQTPRRGGTFRISLGDPPHFDPHLTVQWGTLIALSFTHSRLLKHKAGPGVAPGTFPIEGTSPSPGRRRATRPTCSAMKLDQEPFRDVRVLRALALATSYKEILAASPLALGQGGPNTVVPAALTEWVIPHDQLSREGQRLYEHDPVAAARLLAEAGHPTGIKVPFETGNSGPDWMDGVRIYLRAWKSAGIEADLKVKEMGAFVPSAMLGRFERLMLGIRGGQLFPDPNLGNDYGGRLMAAWLDGSAK